MKYESKPYAVFCFFNVLCMIFIIIVCAYPLLNVFAKSINAGADTALGGITIYPRKFTLANFQALFRSNQIYRATVISILRVICGTTIAVIVQFAAAYALRKKDLPYKRLLMIFLVIPMYFGGGLIPTYILYSKLNLLNNFLVYILPGAFVYYNMILIIANLESIPDSVEESAQLDGANEITILFRIILPMAKPILATITLYVAVGYWNDWTTTLMFVTNKNLRTLQYILYQMINESKQIEEMAREAAMGGKVISQVSTPTSESLKAAQTMVTVIPIILLYPFLQKYFIKGIVVGAVKM